MIIERVIANLRSLDPAHAETYRKLRRERVILPSASLITRQQLVTTDHGSEIELRLAAPPGEAGDLCDGDILHIDHETMVVVSVQPTDVLVIAPHSTYEMGIVAHSLGGRSLQAQFFDANSEYAREVMVVQFDHAVESYLKYTGVPYNRQRRVLPVPFRRPEPNH